MPVADKDSVPVADKGSVPVADNGPVPVAESAPVTVTNNGPAPVAEGTPGSFAFGYSYLNMNLGGTPSANLHGLAGSATINVLPRWGAALDSTYVRAGRDPGSGHSSYVLSVLAGPVFIPKRTNNTRFLLRALGGVSLVDSSVQVNQLYYRGWLARFSWAVGAGIERNLPPIKNRFPFAVRFNVDYLRTKFLSSSATVQPQNGLRFSASFVYRFGPRETSARYNHR
jgi:hypothetical protein